MKKQITISIIIITIGLILFIVGLSLKVPSDQLSTTKIFDDNYTYVEEYFAFDLYNFIIAATLLGGKISGAVTQKAIFIAVGLLVMCIGLTIMAITNKNATNHDNINTPTSTTES